jgi:hypothetical protein
MVQFGRKQPSDERVINMGQMDSATCAEANGVLNENRQCLLNAVRHPDDPDTLIIRKMRYHKPGEGISPQD